MSYESFYSSFVLVFKMMDETDSLKDWLVVIRDPFHKNVEKVRLQFHVAWNEHSEKVSENS